VCTNICTQIVILYRLSIYMYIYIYIWMCVCVVISKCLSACLDGQMTHRRSGWDTKCLRLANWWFRNLLFFSFVATALLGPRSPNCWNLEITHRHTTFGRTPLGEGSARRKIRMRQTSLLQVRFEPTVPASEWPQTYALDRAPTDIGGLGISGTGIH